VFILQKRDNHNLFIWSNSGRLYDDYLELQNPVYQIDQEKTTGKAPDWKRSVLKSDSEYGYKIYTNKETLKAEESKLDNVSILALNLKDYFHLYYWAQKTGAPESSLIMAIICSTFFMYIFFPLIMIFMLFRIVENKN